MDSSIDTSYAPRSRPFSGRAARRQSGRRTSARPPASPPRRRRDSALAYVIGHLKCDERHHSRVAAAPVPLAIRGARNLVRLRVSGSSSWTDTRWRITAGGDQRRGRAHRDRLIPSFDGLDRLSFVRSRRRPWPSRRRQSCAPTGSPSMRASGLGCRLEARERPRGPARFLDHRV